MHDTIVTLEYDNDKHEQLVLIMMENKAAIVDLAIKPKTK